MEGVCVASEIPNTRVSFTIYTTCNLQIIFINQ